MKTILITLALLLSLVSSSIEAQQVTVSPLRTPNLNAGVNQAGAPSRTVTQGPATINCAPLSDSRCGGTAASPSALPSCTVTPNPASIEMGNAASVASMITANCSTGVTTYQWTATNGTTPIGQQQSITYFNPGSYCYSVAGRNPSVNLNFGAASPQACVTVTRTAQNTQCSGASALPWNTSDAGWGAVVNNSYSTCSSGPTNQAGFQYYLLDTTAMNSSTCPWVGPHTNSLSCGSCGFGTTWNGSVCQTTTPTCTGGRTWNGSSCECGPGQTFNTTFQICQTSTPTCTGGRFWDEFSNSCQCPGTQTWNAGTQSCQDPPPTCTGGRTWNGSACVCSGTDTWNGSSCVPAIPNCVLPQQLINGSCQCPLSTSGTSACPSPTVGTYSFTTSYSGPTCAASTTSNQSSACTNPSNYTCFVINAFGSQYAQRGPIPDWQQWLIVGSFTNGSATCGGYEIILGGCSC